MTTFCWVSVDVLGDAARKDFPRDLGGSPSPLVELGASPKVWKDAGFYFLGLDAGSCSSRYVGMWNLLFQSLARSSLLNRRLSPSTPKKILSSKLKSPTGTMGKGSQCAD